jgi:hypothetical protein
VTRGCTAIKSLVVCNYTSSFPGGHVLIRLKAKDSNVSKRPDLFAIYAATVALRTILEKPDVALSRDRANGSNVSRRTADVNHDDSASFIAYALDHIFWIQAKRVIDVCQDWDSSVVDYRAEHSDPQIRWDDYFLTGTNTKRRQRRMQRTGPAAHGQCVFDS